jgi:uncharacterized membrane protein YdjX (TVP38/TMEM64 family)
MGNNEEYRLRRNLYLLVALVLALLGLALAWKWSPLQSWLDIDRIVGTLRQMGQEFGPLAAIAGFTLASILAVPLVFLILVSIVAFGPLAGSLYLLAGATIGSAISYGVGNRLGQTAVRHLAGKRVNAISERLARRGILAAIAIRLIPAAPFAVVNMIAGSSHIRLRDFLIGSTLGMMPGIVVMALFVDRILAAVQNPGPSSLVLALLAAVLILAGAWGAKVWAEKRPEDVSEARRENQKPLDQSDLNHTH